MKGRKYIIIKSSVRIFSVINQRCMCTDPGTRMIRRLLPTAGVAAGAATPSGLSEGCLCRKALAASCSRVQTAGGRGCAPRQLL